MDLSEIKSLKFQVGLVYMLMCVGLVITMLLASFVKWYYVAILSIPQMLCLWFFKPVTIMEYLDYCWALQRVNKEIQDDNQEGG
jgi:hypothetical protein